MKSINKVGKVSSLLAIFLETSEPRFSELSDTECYLGVECPFVTALSEPILYSLIRIQFDA
jgi:hypothetical protein